MADAVINSVPYNIQAEQMLLGSILINPDALNSVVEFLHAEHFFEKLHQKIYASICSIVDKGITPTQIAIKTMLNNDQTFEANGGIKYLSTLVTMGITLINPYEYGKLILDLANKRSLIKIGEEIIKNAYNQDITYSSTKQIEEAEEKLYNLVEKGDIERNFIKVSTTVNEEINNIAKAMKNTRHVVGISTGLVDLDSHLSGFHNSDLVILAGRPSMGKTAFAINLAINACKHFLSDEDKDKQRSVGFFSLEMSASQIVQRLLSSYSKVNSNNLRSGMINAESYNSLYKAATEISLLPLFIDDTPSLPLSVLRAKARTLKRKHNLGILFVDYLQLIKSGSTYGSMVHEITAISQGLKAIAKELGIPVIALSQLSRAVEAREDKRPMLSDLRESGSIEQDADIVMFIYREEYYLSRKEPVAGSAEHLKWQSRSEEVSNRTDIIIAKHRNGAVGSVPLYYNSAESHFDNFKR